MTITATPTNFDLSEEHNLVRTSVSQMLQRFEPRREEFRENARHEKRFPQELWDGFAEVGLMGCLVPEEYGGNGAGLLALTIGFEEISANGFSPGLLLVTAMDSACLLKNASPGTEAALPAGIADGSLKLCFAITEPDAGTNTFRLKTHAEARRRRLPAQRPEDVHLRRRRRRLHARRRANDDAGRARGAGQAEVAGTLAVPRGHEGAGAGEDAASTSASARS